VRTRVLVVGYGTFGKRVADAVMAQSDMELVGVCTPRANANVFALLRRTGEIPLVACDKESVVVPENIDAVRALATDVPSVESVRTTDSSLGVLSGRISLTVARASITMGEKLSSSLRDFLKAR
jgi:saccharopine dehydrogenase-like NADP-dependent oxidoreductase